MMRFKSVALALAVSSLLTAPLSADVIPSKIRTASERSARQAVSAHLAILEMTPAEADRRVSSMTQGTLAHYAASPQSLQIVGQNGPETGQDFVSGQTSLTTYEAVLGTVMLGGSILVLGSALLD